jgi:hypothetical protein
VRHPLRTFLVLAALALLPALVLIWVAWAFLGRERRTGYDREYEQEPPTATEPALVPTLLRQGGGAAGRGSGRSWCQTSGDEEENS